MSAPLVPPRPVTFTPIGVVRSPLVEPAQAARQPYAAREIEGTIELYAGHHFEDALSDLDGFDHIWVVFHFDRVTGWRPKVLPPRSAKRRRGVFATRSPHRPNPIGLSVLELRSIEGLTLKVRGLDLLDGTPVLDIKPYLAYADAVPDARTGWVTALAAPEDPEPGFDVAWSHDAREKLDWLRDHGLEIEPDVRRVLELGPQPHAYRRIKQVGAHRRLAVKEWRFDFEADGRTLRVIDVRSGYSDRALGAAEPGDAAGGGLAVHRAFRARFGPAA
jgi:tRNA (adenine37-N6)-methyltransferase